MPNGGSDCCATCIFKRKLDKDERIECWIHTYCIIRNEHIINPGYTYCANWHTRCRVAQGPIFIYGNYSEGDYRLPWHNKNMPVVGADGKCFICNVKFEEGIEIKDEEKTKLFCSCKHYIEWWKDIHPDEVLMWNCINDDSAWQETMIFFYNKAIKINPKNLHALFEKGLLHADLGQFEITLKCFEKIITLEPENSIAWNNKGYALEKLNFLEEAINCYKKALKSNPNNSNARKNLNKLRFK